MHGQKNIKLTQHVGNV